MVDREVNKAMEGFVPISKTVIKVNKVGVSAQESLIPKRASAQF